MVAGDLCNTLKNVLSQTTKYIAINTCEYFPAYCVCSVSKHFLHLSLLSVLALGSFIMFLHLENRVLRCCHWYQLTRIFKHSLWLAGGCVASKRMAIFFKILVNQQKFIMAVTSHSEAMLLKILFIWQRFIMGFSWIGAHLNASHSSWHGSCAWASYRIRKIVGYACAGNAGNVFPVTVG